VPEDFFKDFNVYFCGAKMILSETCLAECRQFGELKRLQTLHWRRFLDSIDYFDALIDIIERV
jgi:hypothetical protein